MPSASEITAVSVSPGFLTSLLQGIAEILKQGPHNSPLALRWIQSHDRMRIAVPRNAFDAPGNLIQMSDYRMAVE
jgi:hypothetical protein